MKVINWVLASVIAGATAGASKAAFANPSADSAPGEGEADEKKESATPRDARAAERTLSPKDIETIARVHHVNQMEIRAGEIARAHADHRRVRSFGELIVRDHTALDKDARDLAERRDVDLTEALARLMSSMTAEEHTAMREQMSALDRLKDTKGAAFDRLYLTTMLSEHANAIRIVRGARDQVEDTELRRSLGRMLPILEQHLEIAENLERTIAGEPQARR